MTAKEEEVVLPTDRLQLQQLPHDLGDALFGARARLGRAVVLQHVRRRWLRKRGAIDLAVRRQDRKSTRLNSSHLVISYAVFCLKKKKKNNTYYRVEIRM